MEIFIGIIFLLFMLLVDWRLNKIYKELRRLNETMERSTTPSAPARGEVPSVFRPQRGEH